MCRAATLADDCWRSGFGVDGVSCWVYATVTDASGNLYVGGAFTVAGDVVVKYIAKWDGTHWSALGTGMNNPVYAPAVSGSDLYAGGSFETAGGKASCRIAQWHAPALVTVTGVAPAGGPTVIGQTVTITGTGFATSGTINMTFGGTHATAVTPGTSTQLACTTPPHAIGLVDVVVTNPDGWQGTCIRGYAY